MTYCRNFICLILEFILEINPNTQFTEKNKKSQALRDNFLISLILRNMVDFFVVLLLNVGRLN